jgi:hypothetical protein
MKKIQKLFPNLFRRFKKKKYEEIDLEDGDDEILNRSLERALRKFKAMEEAEKGRPVGYSKASKPAIVNRKCYNYVKTRIYLPLEEDEFAVIETGFRILWDHAGGQMLGDYDFKRAVDLYLTSIESPMDREKMGKVVDLMLEYQEEIGEWTTGNEL